MSLLQVKNASKHFGSLIAVDERCSPTTSGWWPTPCRTRPPRRWRGPVRTERVLGNLR